MSIIAEYRTKGVKSKEPIIFPEKFIVICSTSSEFRRIRFYFRELGYTWIHGKDLSDDLGLDIVSIKFVNKKAFHAPTASLPKFKDIKHFNSEDIK